MRVICNCLGFIVEAELGDDAEREDQLCVFISEIVKGGLAYHQGKTASQTYSNLKTKR